MNRAAFEKLLETPMKKIKATDFLEALKSGDSGVNYLIDWPEKKKVELYLEPEGEIPFGKLFDCVRNEKKKREIELPPDFNPNPPVLPPWVNEKKKVEIELPPGFFNAQSAQLDTLLDRLEERLASRSSQDNG